MINSGDDTLMRYKMIQLVDAVLDGDSYETITRLAKEAKPLILPVERVSHEQNL